MSNTSVSVCPNFYDERTQVWPPSTALLFYGVASAYTHECVEIARRCGLHIHGFVHNLPDDPPPGFAPLFRSGTLGPPDSTLALVIPLITPAYRRAIVAETESLGFTGFFDLTHPSAQIATTVKFGTGFSVNAGVVIGAKSRIGRHVLINRSASVGHHVTLNDYVTLGPSCCLGGHVRVESGAFVGLNATVLPEINIGADAVVGAGAVVTRDVPPNTVVFGNPARVIRTGIPGYNL